MLKITPVLLLVLFIIIMTNSAYGHKLITHDGKHVDFDSALQIPDHRVSWAIYDNLEADKAKFYTFDAKHGDALYASILIPKINGLEEYAPSLLLVRPPGLENDSTLPEDWSNAESFPYVGEFPGDEFYEPFGQVTYWERQEVRTHILTDGRYFIVVADDTGRDGKYAFSIGTIEDFSGEDFLVTLPVAWLETKIFVNDYLSVGVFFSILIIVPAIVVILIIRRLRLRISKTQ